MFLFKDFGVHDWCARLPSTTFAFIMVALIYLHMRRFAPAGIWTLRSSLWLVPPSSLFSERLDDMQMAAPMAIGLLGWYAWFETDSKFWLYRHLLFYRPGYAGQGTGGAISGYRDCCCLCLSAAGLVDPVSLLLVAGNTTLLCHGAALVIAVQHQNPTFFREFFLEHNLERFATDRYQHVQPFW